MALPPVPEFLQPLLGTSPRSAQWFYGTVAVLTLAFLFFLWLKFGRGPRRRRKYRRAQLLLKSGAWHEALGLVRDLQARRQSVSWQRRLRRLEGECQRAAGAAALQAKDYEAGLEHSLRAAQLLEVNEVEVRVSVVETMLAEVRRLFAVSSSAGTEPVHQVLGRVLILQSPCAEASFWQGLCHVRDVQTDLALASLHTARGGEGTGAPASGFIDPPLYLGALLLRQGQAKEALRYLTEANRIDGNCPVVTCQLGTAMLAAGGDTQI